MEEKIYCADHHFFHQPILDWAADTRPFRTLDQMHEALVEAHNARAENSTDVYIIGDFAYKAEEKKLRKIFEKMKGRKHLIYGNHDNREVLNLRWSSEPKPWRTVKDGDKKIFLCHYAVASWPGMYNKHYHMYGHTHGKLPSHGRSIDVGVDAWDMSPVSADEAIARMKTWNTDFDNYWPERNSVIQCSEDNHPEKNAFEPEIRDHSDASYNSPGP